MSLPRIVLDSVPTIEEFAAWLAPMRASRQFKDNSALAMFFFEWGAEQLKRVELFVELALLGCSKPTLAISRGGGTWSYSVVDVSWPAPGFRTQEIRFPTWVPRTDLAIQEALTFPYRSPGGYVNGTKRESAGPVRRIVAKLLEEERVTP
jgi:hypothetical protein